MRKIEELPCPDHGLQPVIRRPTPSLMHAACPEPGCPVSGHSAVSEEAAFEAWREIVGAPPAKGGTT